MGHQQARLLADFVLAKDNEARVDGKNGEPKRDYFGFTHLYTSLMVRSVATATYVSRAIGLELVAWPEIHECGGIYMDSDEEEERVGYAGQDARILCRALSGSDSTGDGNRSWLVEPSL